MASWEEEVAKKLSGLRGSVGADTAKAEDEIEKNKGLFKSLAGTVFADIFDLVRKHEKFGKAYSGKKEDKSAKFENDIQAFREAFLKKASELKVNESAPDKKTVEEEIVLFLKEEADKLTSGKGKKTLATVIRDICEKIEKGLKPAESIEPIETIEPIEIKPEPTPISEPKPEPEPTPKPESKPESKPEPTPKPEPDPEPEPKPEPKPEPEPEPKPEPKPEPEPKKKYLKINEDEKWSKEEIEQYVNFKSKYGIDTQYENERGERMQIVGFFPQEKIVSVNYSGEKGLENREISLQGPYPYGFEAIMRKEGYKLVKTPDKSGVESDLEAEKAEELELIYDLVEKFWTNLEKEPVWDDYSPKQKNIILETETEVTLARLIRKSEFLKDQEQEVAKEIMEKIINKKA